MTTDELYEWMADPSLLTKASLSDLRQMVDDFPYFHAGRLLYLKNLAILRDVRLEKELKKMSVYVPGRRQLFLLINDRLPDGDKKKEARTSSAKKNKTDIVFDVIKKAPSSDGEPDEKDFISTITTPKPVSPPATAAADYAKWLAHNAEDLPEEDGADHRLKHQDLIDSFIENDKKQLVQRMNENLLNKESEAADESEIPKPEALGKSTLDDSYFTETLARVYINQKRYDKALEIIRALCLKYPNKNVYFADQIRYLERIINLKK